MTDNRTHPLVIIAATTVILTCLLAIGIMTGIVPSPWKAGAPVRDLTTGSAQNAPAANAPATVPQNRLASKAPAAATRKSAPAGTTQSGGPSQTVAGSGPAAAPVCTDCATVTSVRTVQQQGEAGLLGPAAGGLVGGVIGHQIGSGRGNTIATIAGAAGGAAVGTEIERRSKSTTHYVVAVRMNDGTVRHFNYRAAPGFQPGDKVRVVEGKLVRN